MKTLPLVVALFSLAACAPEEPLMYQNVIDRLGAPCAVVDPAPPYRNLPGPTAYLLYCAAPDGDIDRYYGGEPRCLPGCKQLAQVTTGGAQTENPQPYPFK